MASDSMDLTFLTQEEISHIREVLDRAKKLEEFHKQQKQNGEQEVTSDDVIRSIWRESGRATDTTFVFARDALEAALSKDVITEKEKKSIDGLSLKEGLVKSMEDTKHENQKHQASQKTEKEEPKKLETSEKQKTPENIETSEKVEMPKKLQTPKKQTKLCIDDSTGSSTLLELATSAKGDELTEHVEQTEQPRSGLSDSLEHTDFPRKTSFASSNNTVDSKTSPLRETSNTPPKIYHTSPTNGKPFEVQNGVEMLDGEEKDELSPLPEESIGKVIPGRRSFDGASMISRASLRPDDFIGEIELCLTYFPPSAVRQKTFPSKGTRFPENKSLDVLTRKTYVILTGAKLPITKGSKSGARSDRDGELHLNVKGACDLVLPTAMKNRARTYLKCYLLPDRYHGSKMRSELIKDTLCPRYEHKFVFRGFSEEELDARAIELVIGGVAATHGRNVVVGGIRLSNGKQDLDKAVPWKDSNEEESDVWKKVFDEPSTEISATIALRAHIKPTYA